MREPNDPAKARAVPRNPDNAQRGLGMAPEAMLELARKAAELVVERIEGLPKGDAWDGDFRETLARPIHEGRL